MSLRRVKGRGRRGLSGLGLATVIAGLLGLAVAYSQPRIYHLWPLVLVAVGLFGLVRRPGWVTELDLRVGHDFGRATDRPRRLFSLALVVVGLLFLVLSLHLVDERWIGPAVLIVLGVLLLWRRAR